MTENNTIQVFGISPESFVDGPGIRYAIFLQGCPHHCPGCHNPESQKIGDEYGKIISIDQIIADISKNPLISGITLTGGEPFIHSKECCALINTVRIAFPSLDVWAWSGFLYEDIISDPVKNELLDLCDVLVDGPFVLSEKTFSCQWRGSSNQRVIDLVETRKQDQIVMHKDN